MSRFVSFMGDFLDKVTPFNKSIAHIHITRNNEGDITVAAPSTDRSVEIHAVTSSDIPELEGSACLGSIMYLKQILGSSFMKQKTEITMNFDTASNGKTHALKSINFKAGRKAELFYQATDPFVGTITMPSRNKIASWPVVFTLSQNSIKEFKEMRSIHAATPGSGIENVFTLAYDEGEVLAIFGSDSHQSSLVISDEIETEKKKQTSYKAYFLIDQFANVLSLTDKKEVIIYFCDKAVKFEFETDQGSYSITLTAKKVVTT